MILPLRFKESLGVKVNKKALMRRKKNKVTGSGKQKMATVFIFKCLNIVSSRKATKSEESSTCQKCEKGNYYDYNLQLEPVI